jgi:1-acyl-sn-glycerol-3-phosphate acyltransferase
VLRAVLAVPLIAADTLVCGVATLVAGLVDRRGRACPAIARGWARVLLLGLGVEVDVEGSDNVPEGPAVYAANHGSAIDIPILFGYLPANFRFIHKRSLYLVPVLGWSLWVAGHVGIDRSNPFRARKSLHAAAQRIQAGTSVAVFPEGTRSSDSGVGPFKRGSFVLALEAGVPVVPVSIRGVKRVVPRGLRTLRPGTVRLVIHPAVPTAGRSVETAESLAEEVRSVVAGGCAEVA